MITQQEKDVKAADKEDADKEDVEETKKGSIKIPSNCHSLFQIYWKRIELLDARKKPTQDILSNYPKPLKQNKIQHHAIKTMNIKSFLTWKLLYLFVVVVNLCHAILDDFWNPMNPIHLPKILKSSLKKVHKSNPSSYYSFIPFNHYDPYLWLSFLNIQHPFAPTHISLQKNPNSLKKKSIPEKHLLTCSFNQLWTPL